MTLHVVLFRPKPGAAAARLEEVLAAIRAAAATIPSVRRFRVGRRIEIGAAYDRGMPEFPYCAVVEFSDVAGLREYLSHPGHQELGALFQELQEAALVFDYDVVMES